MGGTIRKKIQMGGTYTIDNELKEIFTILNNKYTVNRELNDKNIDKPPSLYDNENDIIKKYYNMWIDASSQPLITNTLEEFTQFKLTDLDEDNLLTIETPKLDLCIITDYRNDLLLENRNFDKYIFELDRSIREN